MIFSVYNRMADFPNQRRSRAKGVLPSVLSLTNYFALHFPKGTPTMLIEIYTVAESGSEKFDILSQRGISIYSSLETSTNELAASTC